MALFEQSSVLWWLLVSDFQSLYSLVLFAQTNWNKLEVAIQHTQPQARVNKLKDLCRTQWVDRNDALDRILELNCVGDVGVTLEDIVEYVTNSSRSCHTQSLTNDDIMLSSLREVIRACLHKSLTEVGNNYALCIL